MKRKAYRVTARTFGLLLGISSVYTQSVVLRKLKHDNGQLAGWYHNGSVVEVFILRLDMQGQKGYIIQTEYDLKRIEALVKPLVRGLERTYFG